jgi:hypothetical protein
MKMKVPSRGNEYASGRCIGIQKSEWFDKVFSARFAKDCLKEMQTKVTQEDKSLVYVL